MESENIIFIFKREACSLCKGITDEVIGWVEDAQEEFGIELRVVEVDPDSLFANFSDLSEEIKVEALADWTTCNHQNELPLVTFDGRTIRNLDDLLRFG